MTRNEYLSNVTGTVVNPQDGEEILKHYLRPFEDVIKYFVPNNMTKREFDELLKTMSS